MCGRFWIDMSVDLYDRYGIEGDEAFEADYNVSPGKSSPVVHGGRIAPMTWGLEARGRKVINARSEGVRDRPMFKALLGEGRCIVPVSGFFEWVSAAGRKVPYNITSADGSLLSLAGLCDTSVDGGAFVILTRGSSGPMRRIHDRMPVIVDRGLERDWLGPSVEDAMGALSPDDAELEAFPVSSDVNDPRSEGDRLIRRVGLF